MLASTLLVSSPAAAAQIKRSGTTIETTGFIMPGDAVQFANLIESMKNGSTVILNSPGGALDDLSILVTSFVTVASPPKCRKRLFAFPAAPESGLLVSSGKLASEGACYLLFRHQGARPQ